MAIKIQHNSRLFQVELPESYHKIDNIRIRNNVVEYDILIFATQEARSNSAQHIDSFTNGVSLPVLETYTGDNIVAKLYEYSKEVYPLYAGKPLDNV